VVIDASVLQVIALFEVSAHNIKEWEDVDDLTEQR